ncbi:type IV pilus modification PilV family protein [Pirellulaceae bacterium SH501]
MMRDEAIQFAIAKRDSDPFLQPSKGAIPQRGRSSRRGLSLLEVVLALAILAVSAALLAQITRQATDNAMSAQKLAHAQMLCESKMAEVLVGAIPMEPLDWTLNEDGSLPGEWYYRLETTTTERENMVGLRLAVTDNPNPVTGSPELFFLMRWVIDPNLGLDTVPTSDPAAMGAGASGTGATGGSAASGASAGSAGGIQ